MSISPGMGYDVIDAMQEGIGSLSETQRTGLRGVLRHMRRLTGMSESQLQSIFGKMRKPALEMGFIPRMRPGGAHLKDRMGTFAPRSEGAALGGIPTSPMRGQFSGDTYAGSFAKVVHLDGDRYLFQNRVYPNRNALEEALMSGKANGSGDYVIRGWNKPESYQKVPQILNRSQPAQPTGNDPLAIMHRIFSQSGGMQAGVPGNAVPGGASGSIEALLGSNLYMEDKLSIMGAGLSNSIDSEIEAKMREIELATQGQPGGAAANGIGTVFGGPAGGTTGTQGLQNAGGVGGAGGTGAAGTAGAGGTNKSPNIQLLQTQLQNLMQERQQLMQLMTNIFKTLHDASMAAIRNLKA